MRVLHVVNAALPDVQSGYTLRTRSVLRAQRRAGFELAVVSVDFGRRAAAPEPVAVDGIPHKPLGYPLDGDRRGWGLRLAKRWPGDGSRRGRLWLLEGWAAEQAADWVRAFSPDLVQAHSPFWVAGTGRRLARAARVPWVYELRGLWAETAVAQGDDRPGSTRHRRDLAAERRLARAADGCLPIGASLAAEVERWGARVLGVAPNVVDPERFAPGPKDARLRAELGLGDGPVVGYVGTLRPLEGIDRCLDALFALPQVRLLLVGGGESLEELRGVVARRGLADRVVFTGPVTPERVVDHYRLIDVFWVPRPDHRVTRLVTPLKPLEAMACGLPVVTSALPALTELVGVTGERGLAFPVTAPARLAELTAALLDDGPRRERIGAAARAWILAHRTEAALGRAYREAFARLGVPARAAR